MSIKSINELTAMTTADLTANDVLVVGTQSGAKKIPAQDAFSGGGGNVVAIEFDYNGGQVTSVDDARDIKALVDDGKALVILIHATPTQTTQLVVNVVDFGSENSIIAYGFNGMTDTKVTFKFIAADLNEGTKFVISA